MNIPYGPILVVEDNANVLELLDVTLRFKGYPVVTARDGKEALEKIEQERPALVISDILMPTMDGFTLVHNLRKEPRTAGIPVIFISATYITPEDKKFALNLGAIRFIEKPIDTGDFLLTVAEILTDGIDSIPAPMADREFYTGYRERLENKLRYKRTQIARTERLLESLPEEQKIAFQSLLDEAKADEKEILHELNELYSLLSQVKSNGATPAPVTGN